MYALSNEQIRRVAPSVFATEAYHAMSDRYQFIPTITVVEAMRANGFVPVMASQSRVRLADRRDFTKHMLRFRQERDMNRPRERGEDIMEIVMSNGHDGSAAYRLCAGIFRVVCSNGLIIKSHSFEEISVKHFGKNIASDVIEGSYHIIKETPRVVDLIADMRAKHIDPQHQRLFAAAAAVARYGVDEHGNLNSGITPDQLLVPRRQEDTHGDVNNRTNYERVVNNRGRSLYVSGERPKQDVWTTFNVVQENMMKGGVNSVSASGRRARTRSVSSVNETLKLNRDLWSLAEDLLKKNVG